MHANGVMRVSPAQLSSSVFLIIADANSLFWSLPEEEACPHTSPPVVVVVVVAVGSASMVEMGYGLVRKWVSAPQAVPLVLNWIVMDVK